MPGSWWKKREPTYEELRDQSAKDWADKQREAGAALETLHANVARMPDVQNAPDPDVPWSSKGIVCECGGDHFHVRRWVTVNGVRYRTELECVTCEGHRTWDWPEKRWIEPERFGLPTSGT